MAVLIHPKAEPIPGYCLLEPIGRGGFGEVWKAEAPGGVLKAIKFVHGNLGSDGDRAFAEQELRALSRVKAIRHPYILAIDRYDIIDGQLVIVMELADRNLKDRFTECREDGLVGVPRAELLAYMEEAAEALDLMNLSFDLQHLDIKPQNLFLVHRHVKVADFGMVKDLHRGTMRLTGGMTPLYAAPETVSGWVSRTTDQYSFAIVYQELLTGQRPFAGTTVHELVSQHLHGRPNLESLPLADRPIIARALDKKPEERFRTCREMVEALCRTDKRTRQVSMAELREQLHSISSVPETPPPPPALEATIADKPATTSGASAAADAARHVRPVREEQVGPGVLCPALVVGLGGLGLAVLQQLRAQLRQRFGEGLPLPHLAMLAIDTDPCFAEQALTGGSGAALNPDEIVHARLNRPAHYLRPRDTRPPIQSWLDPRIVHRLPRQLTTGGMRAIGRLALVDHFESICARLQRGLEQITAPDALPAAARHTGLGLRSNRPRVYLAAGIAGGTGGGMFLDLAYVVRALLREFGFRRQEVIGILYLPAEKAAGDAAMPLANTIAALVELDHFSQKGESFHAYYDTRYPAIQDAAPPFERILLQQLPPDAGTSTSAELAAPMGDYLQRELMTSLVPRSPRTSDGEKPGSCLASGSVSYETVGFHVLSSTRRGIARQAARTAAARLLEAWATEAAPGQVPRVRRDLLERLNAEQLDPARAEEFLRAECARALGWPAQAMFARILEEARPDPSAAPQRERPIRQVIQQLDELLGPPSEALRPETSTQGRVPECLFQTIEAYSERAARVLSDAVTRYLDVPEHRLNAAEEGTQQLIAIFHEYRQHAEELARQASLRQHMLAVELDPGLVDYRRTGGGFLRARPALAPNEQFKQLAAYPNLRFDQLVQEALSRAFGQVGQQFRRHLGDLQSYREALLELVRNLRALDGVSSDDAAGAAELLGALPPDDWARLEAFVQDGLDHQLLGPSKAFASPGFQLGPMLQAAVVQRAELYLNQRFPGADILDLFLSQYSRESEAAAVLKDTYATARPLLRAAPQDKEETILLVPPGKSAARFARIADQAVRDAHIILEGNQDEIVICRRNKDLRLTDLPQLDPRMREIYARARVSEQSTPHARMDISQWRMPEERVGERGV